MCSGTQFTSYFWLFSSRYGNLDSREGQNFVFERIINYVSNIEEFVYDVEIGYIIPQLTHS